MKRFLRICIGTSLFVAPMVLSTWVWLFVSNKESWTESVGKFSWYLISGQWEKLPE